MVNATTTARVKRLIDTTSTDHEEVLESIIAAVSAEIEDFIGYELELTQRVELHSIRGHDQVLFLRTIPVVSVDEVRIAGDWNFAGASALTADTDYRAILGGVGEVRLLSTIAGVETAQVTYTAGFGATPTAVVAAAPKIAYAADLQCAEEFRRRREPATTSRTGPRGNRNLSPAHSLLPRVRELLQGHVRIIIGAYQGVI